VAVAAVTQYFASLGEGGKNGVTGVTGGMSETSGESGNDWAGLDADDGD
jgi:hypothetical protein